MLTRRTVAAALAAILLSTSAATPASAAKPIKPPAADAERELTPEERSAAERRFATAEAYEATVRSKGTDLAAFSCPVPESTTASSPTTASTDSCSVPQGFLGVEARDQVSGHYCGPAVGQVIANYSWAMGAGVNKYTQGRIAVWMGTDEKGQTDAFGMEDGLEAATIRSPRRPSNWDWVVAYLQDRDGDGATGDELHSYVRSNISASRMPMAIPVKPHAWDSQFNLSSWPNPVASPGHWIGIYGWYNTWDGSDRARMYFTDSSRDEGGATGKFWNPTRHIAALIGEHTRRFVW